MGSGGKRAGAGRKAILSSCECEQVGRACERVWYWLSGPKRPYYSRPYVIEWASQHFTRVFGKHVSNRRVEAAWKLARSSGAGRAQPGDLGYEDAKAFDAWLEEVFYEYDGDE